MQIAIDGPCAAGKTTTAKAVARRLNFLYVDTGAFYRTVALFALQSQCPYVDMVLSHIDMKAVRDADGNQRMILMGEDVTDQLRTEQISKLASDLSAIPSVRDFLLERQRETARNNSVVMEGRDIGSVVLPDADLKVYLTADEQTRAKRRCLELTDRIRQPVDFTKVYNDLKIRDYNDSHRETAPLVRTPDAYLLDNSNLTADETVDAVLDLWKCVLSTQRKG